jgi:ubiquinone/menaquinone biosynthesis C-methylase UbiE
MSSPKQTPIPQEDSKPGRQIKYLSTLDAYEKWAQVYDSDGNVLQAIDDEEVTRLVPQVLSLAARDSQEPLRIVDLGCGTGRNTLKLLNIPGAEIYGLDLSPKMLEIAKERCTSAWEMLPAEKRASSVKFGTHDVLDPKSDDQTTRDLQQRAADIVISTLVVEHMPLADFFKELDRLLAPGGVLLVTNMHSEMGAKSQAGFNDPTTGEKIRPVSYNHTLENLVEAANAAGYELVGDSVVERGVDGEMAQRLGSSAGKWIGIKMWMGGIFRKMNVA